MNCIAYPAGTPAMELTVVPMRVCQLHVPPRAKAVRIAAEHHQDPPGRLPRMGGHRTDVCLPAARAAGETYPAELGELAQVIVNTAGRPHTRSAAFETGRQGSPISRARRPRLSACLVAMRSATRRACCCPILLLVLASASPHWQYRIWVGYPCLNDALR